MICSFGLEARAIELTTESIVLMTFGLINLLPLELYPHPVLQAPEYVNPRRAPAMKRTPGSRVNSQVGRELKARAHLLRLTPPTPGSGEQNNEHSPLV